jgi:hypothetical protein
MATTLFSRFFLSIVSLTEPFSVACCANVDIHDMVRNRRVVESSFLMVDGLW